MGEQKNQKKMSFLKRIRKESWRWKFLGPAFKWKRLNNIRVSFFDDVLFKIISVLEAVVLVATVSFFFLCCGCHF
ncbi:uncharacterized protein LOC120015427 [Tripterygium wilfordii]|uniref:uncharacterized protein LOC120015427 n=1 Tax=Tripterygium wilfordii TaxID=458696 RepID=UPI0018F84E9A|nr:uncharacterized protein LOC120015427 [Tripterygium wilfordii]